MSDGRINHNNLYYIQKVPTSYDELKKKPQR